MTVSLGTILVLVGTILCGIDALLYLSSRTYRLPLVALGATLIGLGVLLGATALKS